MPFINVPEHGACIVFAKVPAASWASPDVPYRVRHSGRDVWLTNMHTGSGTYDPQWAYERSVWSELNA